MSSMARKKVTDFQPQRHNTNRHTQRCGGFPDQFIITGSYGQIHARIGNSAPPLFMRGIARHVRQYLR